MESLEQELHVRDYLRVLYKRRMIALAIFCIMVAVVVTRTLLATPIYQATTRVMVEKAPIQNISVVNPFFMAWDPDFYNTQTQLIKSVAVGEKVVAKLSLEENFGRAFGGKALPVAEAGDEEGPGEAESRPLALARTISGGLVVAPIKDSKVMTISYESPNPELAALIVNAAVEAYMEELLEMKMSASRYTIDWMSGKAKEEAVKLEGAERKLQAYMKANDIVTLENRITITPQRLSELSMELTKAETKRRQLETLHERVSSGSDGIEQLESLHVVESTPALQSLRQQVLRAEQNIMELSKKYGEKHPRMAVARSELEVLSEKQAEEARRAVDSVRNEYEMAEENEKNLRRRLAATKNEAQNLNEKFIQYAVLKREVETSRQFYDALMTKTKEQSITEQIQTIEVWVIEKAEVPKGPVRPRKGRNILVGLILGLFGGVGTAFFAEYLDNTVKSPEEAEQKTGQPVLGIIPRLKEKDKNVERTVMDEPTSPLGESYKALRTSLILSKADKPAGSIMITSAIPSEGKTATAINTAVATALSGHSVLLVDGDLRRHRVHRVFDLPNVKGLSTYLAGVSDRDIISPTSVENLSVMTPGPVPPNPSELMGSPKMGKLIKEVKKQFDLVIFDTSPVLTVTDSLVISRYVDATVVVVRAGKTTYDMVRRSLRMLEDVNAPVLGIVLNDFDEKRSGYYYYYRDNYYYQFDQKSESPGKARGERRRREA